MNLSFIFQIIGLISNILHTVHEVQASLPGSPGAEKSQLVIDKVTPIADSLGAQREHIQSIIDGAVGIFKGAKIGAWAPAAQEQQAP